MTTKADVKINLRYDRIEAADPVDVTDDIAVGTRWLNSTTGDSFEQTASGPSVWVQIEQELDARIDRVLPTTYARIVAECRDGLLRFRDEALEESPDTITKTDYWYLNQYVSLYADWTITGAAISASSATDIVGDLADLEDGDEVFIIGSKRNDGVHTVSTVDSAGLTFSGALTGSAADRFVVALAEIPTDLEQIIGRMIYYDVEIRGDRLGLQSESIGNYRYRLAEDMLVGGIGYPRDVASGIDSYLGVGPIADAEEIW
jgi:hypothetical protein